MKRARFTEEQIIGILRENEAGAKAGELARKHGVSEGTIYAWKAKFGGMSVSEAQRLRTLEDENAKLKRLLADAMLDKAALQELLSKNGRAAARREGVAHLQSTLGMSQRRACAVVQADRKMVRYRSRRAPDTELRERLRGLAAERRRFGYRRLFVLLRREGEPSGKNRIYRLYREEGLAVRKRRSRRRAIGARAPILVEAKANARWSLDFVHDQLAGGRRFRILNVVDDVTRECLAAIADTSLSGRRVARELTALVGRRGRPGMIVSDNGTEFTSTAILAWAEDQRVAWHYIAPGKPTQNGFQWAHARRAAERDLVLQPRARPPEAGRLGLRLQHPPTALVDRLPDPCGLCRAPDRNRPSRCAVGKLRAPACCFHRARRRNQPRDSRRRWMKVQRQVRVHVSERAALTMPLRPDTKDHAGDPSEP